MSGLHVLGRRRSTAVVGGDAENDAAEHAAVIRALQYGTASYTAPACGAAGDAASWLHFMIFVVLVLVALCAVERLLKRRKCLSKTRETHSQPFETSDQTTCEVSR